MEGLIVPTVTALSSDGTFDAASQERLLAELAQLNVGGIFALGLTGETSYLDNKTRQQVMEVTANVVRSENPNVPVVVGIHGDSREEFESNARYMADLPAHAVVVQQASTYSMSFSDLARFASDASGKPVITYVNTSKPDSVVSPEELASLEGVVIGAKISSPIERFRPYAQHEYPEGFSLYVGNAIDIFQLANEGNLPEGVVSGPANAFPFFWQHAWEQCTNGGEAERAEYLAAAQRVKGAYDGLPSGKNTLGFLKHVLRRMGLLDSSRCMGTSPSEADAQYIDEFIASSWREARTAGTASPSECPLL